MPYGCDTQVANRRPKTTRTEATKLNFPSKAITPQLKFCPNLFSCVAVVVEGNYALSPYVLEWTERAVLENES